MRRPRRPDLKAATGGWVWYVLSAALVAGGVQVSLEYPPIGCALLLFASAFAGYRIHLRNLQQRLLFSGDISRVLQGWKESFERAAYPEALEPLFRATVLASHGLTKRARQVLRLAKPGPEWESALEHRLFLNILLDAIDGDRQRALQSAKELGSLPLPASRWARSRAITLRNATQALARAFAKRSKPADVRWLSVAQRQNPLIALPLRYAEVAASIQSGKYRRARSLLAVLPQWPHESAFRELAHDLGAALDAHP